MRATRALQVTPFLILAIGVDNMFLLAQLEATHSHIWHIPDRIAATLEAAGPSIALASLAEALAFAVAALTPMPAVRCFAVVAAVAVLLDFALQLTAFVALLTLDCERTRDGRADCWPCWAQRAPVSSTPLSRDFQVRSLQNIRVPMQRTRRATQVSLHSIGEVVALCSVYAAVLTWPFAVSVRVRTWCCRMLCCTGFSCAATQQPHDVSTRCAACRSPVARQAIPLSAAPTTF